MYLESALVVKGVVFWEYCLHYYDDYYDYLIFNFEISLN